MSDLHADFQGHRELPPLADGVDVVIVAGDTCEGLVESLEMLRAAYPSPVEIVAVAGNHEFYSQVHRVELAAGRECASSLGIHLLENDCVMLGSVRIVGATLWTNYGLFGPRLRDAAMRTAFDSMRDHKKIKWNRDPWQRFRPQEALFLHQQSRQFIESVLAQSHAGATILVTHHPTTMESINSPDERNLLASAYTSDLSVTWPDHWGPDVAISGHTHWAIDFRRRKTRFISNPRGYPGEATRFNPEFTIEVPND
jgi:predicted phosphodiesterase